MAEHKFSSAIDIQDSIDRKLMQASAMASLLCTDDHFKSVSTRLLSESLFTLANLLDEIKENNALLSSVQMATAESMEKVKEQAKGETLQ